MAHSHNPNWPDGYRPTAIEVHMNFARLIAEQINDDVIVDSDSLLTTNDVLDECATFGCALVPDFTGMANKAYAESLVPGSAGGTR